MTLSDYSDGHQRPILATRSKRKTRPVNEAPTWSAALDTLEAHILHVEEIIVGLTAEDGDFRINPWVKPHGLGPMPTELVDRAMALRERQAALIARIPEVLIERRREAELLTRHHDAGPTSGGSGRHSAAVYVDVSA